MLIKAETKLKAKANHKLPEKRHTKKTPIRLKQQNEHTEPESVVNTTQGRLQASNTGMNGCSFTTNSLINQEDLTIIYVP